MDARSAPVGGGTGMCRITNRQDCRFAARSDPNEVRARVMDVPQPIKHRHTDFQSASSSLPAVYFNKLSGPRGLNCTTVHNVAVLSHAKLPPGGRSPPLNTTPSAHPYSIGCFMAYLTSSGLAVMSSLDCKIPIGYVYMTYFIGVMYLFNSYYIPIK